MLSSYRALRILKYRTCSTSLRHPDKIFSTFPPPPPPWPKSTSLSPSPTWTSSSPLQWKESDREYYRRLDRVLSKLQRTLRCARRRMITWPAEEVSSSNLSPSQYLMMLLQPIPNIFNQLRSSRTLKAPMECIHVDFCQPICWVTFTAEGFKRWNSTAPIILPLLGDLFHSNGKVSPFVGYALSKALEHTSSATIIFKDIAVFFPPMGNRSEAIFERISTTQPSLALRVICTAYLLDHLPRGFSIKLPYQYLEPDEERVPLQGPPQDPYQPLLADEEVFATHHRHSDFDMTTLVRDRARALQFFRWHEHVQKKFKLVTHPNDMLTAVTNEAGWIVPDIHPTYPFNTSEIPFDTAAHLRAIQRESPLVTSGVDESFKRSKSFTLKIQNVVAEGSKRGICTVYRCQLTSIDNVRVSPPSLCLKLFDDRFQLLRSPKEDNVKDERVPRWFDPVLIAETFALNEAFAYNKLRPVQGSIVPWFYGTHQFTLPDGTILYGLLMEYIEGWNLRSNFAWELTPDRQIKMIQSCRHTARVLDIADVSQRDWHSDQVILYTNPTTGIDHVVTFDFALTTQTLEARRAELHWKSL